MRAGQAVIKQTNNCLNTFDCFHNETRGAKEQESFERTRAAAICYSLIHYSVHYSGH